MLRVVQGPDGWAVKLQSQAGTHVLICGLSSEAMAAYFVAVYISALARANAQTEDEATRLLRQYITKDEH